MKIGVLGGTFDPPHNGHIAIADACLAQLSLDEIIFLPSNLNPLKFREIVTPAPIRVRMLQKLLAGHPNFAISDMDVTRGGKSYAVDSLAELHMVRPADYWFVMGTDAVKLLPQWKSPARLLKLCRVAMVTRPPLNENEILARLPHDFAPHIDPVHIPPIDISSTMIRDRIHEKRDVSALVPAAVMSFIRENKLYQAA